MADINDDEKPLDPEIEAIRRRMMRLLMISGGIMFVGLMTVLIAIVYKINQGSESSAARQVTAAELVLPAGASITDTGLSNGKMVLTLKLENGSTAIYVYNSDGTVAARYTVK